MGVEYERTSTPGIDRRGKSYVVKERDALGARLTRSYAMLTEARKVKAAIRADAARGERRPHTRMALDDYAREWIATSQGRTSRGLMESTRIGYESDLENHAIPFFKRTALTEIEPRDVKRFAAACTKQGGLSKRSVRRVMAPVKALFATAFEDGMIRVNPAANVQFNEANPTPMGKVGDRGVTAAVTGEVTVLVTEHGKRPIVTDAYGAARYAKVRSCGPTAESPYSRTNPHTCRQEWRSSAGSNSLRRRDWNHRRRVARRVLGPVE